MFHTSFVLAPSKACPAAAVVRPVVVLAKLTGSCQACCDTYFAASHTPILAAWCTPPPPPPHQAHLLASLFCCPCCCASWSAASAVACLVLLAVAVYLQELEEQEHAARNTAAGPDVDIDALLDDPELERLHRYSSRGTQGQPASMPGSYAAVECPVSQAHSIITTERRIALQLVGLEVPLCHSSCRSPSRQGTPLCTHTPPPLPAVPQSSLQGPASSHEAGGRAAPDP